MRAAGEAWRLSTRSSDSGAGGSSGVVHCSVLSLPASPNVAEMCRLHMDTGLWFWLFIVGTLVDIQVACTVERDGD